MMQRLRTIWLIALVSTLLITGIARLSAVSADSCQLITRLGDQPTDCAQRASSASAAGTPNMLTSTASGPAVYHMVLPKETDPAIDDALSPHIAGAPPCADPQRDFLVIFIPGTANPATQGRPLLDVATRNCMHGIGLSYPNKEAAFTDCTNDPDPDCFEQWRLQKLDGVQRSPHLSTTPPNSIENRLLKLLQYLTTTFPSEGWSRYLDAGAVRWQAVIASGQSQGGGEAALLGKIHPLARVVMLASITDTIGGFSGSSPAWAGKPGVTPAERYFGFAHMKDQYWSGEQQNWAALNLPPFGPVVNTDSEQAPYKGSHMLTTDVAYDTSVPNGAHPTTIAARNAEKFGPVWAYMLIPDEPPL